MIMGYLSKFENTVIDLIKNHNGLCMMEIYEKLNQKKQVLSVNTLRHLLRKLVNEKKIVATGVHQFKYYTSDSRVVSVNSMWKNMFATKSY